MLVEFRCRNFRSVSDEMVLSLVAAKDKALIESNTIETNAPGLPRLVRSAVIYGANASGKTTLVRALQLMRGVVVESASLQPGQLYNVQPFLLNKDSPNVPTMFEVTTLISGVRYQYGFELTRTRITAEWLLVYQKSKPQLWFERKAISELNDEFKFGSHLGGAKRLWQEATRPNALFLSTALQLNSSDLAPLYNWFVSSLAVYTDGGQMPADLSTEMIRTPTGQLQVSSFLSSADIAIKSISAEPTKGISQTFMFDLANNKPEIRSEETEIHLPKFRHASGDVTAEFDLMDESQGTQKLYALAGPLFQILRIGGILVIDELDRSLHPLLVRQIVNIFQDPKVNCNGSQLVFTTHDTTLLNGALFRRDQVWFTEKGHDQSSRLVPLSDFSARKDEAFEKGYLSGRYGGVPILPSGLVEEMNCGEG